MELSGRTIALYGRFSEGARAALTLAIEARGGKTSRELTRQASVLVVGGRATSLIESGALLARLKIAYDTERLVLSEAAFAQQLEGGPASNQTALPLPVALSKSGLALEDAHLLAAFDLIVIQGGACRFGDSSVMQTAASLRASGSSLPRIIDVLLEVRRAGPAGRYQVAIGPDGRPSLKWEDGHTTLDGQGLLPLDPGGATIDDLFEEAIMADAEGRWDEAAQIFDMCARSDRKDGIALYNLANIRLRQERWDDAAFAYQRAIAREPGLVEARYNLAQALEASGRDEAAAVELEKLLEMDPEYPDALFNLAQLHMNSWRLSDARRLYERYLGTNPTPEWAAKARKAIAYCARE